jgi:hypothetical protein
MPHSTQLAAQALARLHGLREKPQHFLHDLKAQKVNAVVRCIDGLAQPPNFVHQIRLLAKVW